MKESSVIDIQKILARRAVAAAEPGVKTFETGGVGHPYNDTGQQVGEGFWLASPVVQRDYAPDPINLAGTLHSSRPDDRQTVESIATERPHDFILLASAAYLVLARACITAAVAAGKEDTSGRC